VLLAWAMNGAPLTPDHGAPLRVVVPGVTGARSVKWLSKVVASSEESASFWQVFDYKAFSPAQGWDNIDWASTPAIQEPPVTSAVCSPSPGEAVSVSGGTLEASGYAWSGGGRGVTRVDVSLDGGRTWQVAELATVPDQPAHRAWGWALWRASLPLPAGLKPGAALEVVCKATDAACNAQPETAAGIWNLRGLVTNSWHRVRVTAAP